MSTYRIGTVTVSNGSTAVTGSGTAWIAVGIRQGDFLFVNGLFGEVASVESNTALTLVRGWPGSSASGQQYSIALIDDGQRSIASLNALLAAIGGSGTITSLAALSATANQMPFFTGAGIMALTNLTSQARTLLGSTILSVSGNNLVTGADALITGGAVQNSGTDNTNGRVLVARPAGGVFGLGNTGAGIVLSELDDPNLAAGQYIIFTVYAGTGPRPPGNVGQGMILRVERYGTNSVHQFMYRQAAGGVTGHWHRSFNSGTWSAWRQIAPSELLGTVSQSDGTITGALLQGNANVASPTGGWTERIADGFQTVHHSLTSSDSADTVWTYNSAFLTGSVPVISIMPVGDSDLRPRLVARTATTCTFSIRNSGGARVAVPVDLIARGRWSNMT